MENLSDRNLLPAAKILGRFKALVLTVTFICLSYFIFSIRNQLLIMNRNYILDVSSTTRRCLEILPIFLDSLKEYKETVRVTCICHHQDPPLPQKEETCRTQQNEMWRTAKTYAYNEINKTRDSCHVCCDFWILSDKH